MNYALLSISIIGVLAAGIVGYFLGRYQANLLEQIHTLRKNQAQPAPEPEKPVVVGGAYQPPRETSNTVDTKRAAGIVDTKTPQQLEWENKNELAKLEHSP